MSDEKHLTYSECLAIRDCSVYKRGEYTWKPKTMQKLAKRGYTEIVDCTLSYRPPGTVAYALTEKGSQALAGFAP